MFLEFETKYLAGVYKGLFVKYGQGGAWCLFFGKVYQEMYPLKILVLKILPPPKKIILKVYPPPHPRQICLVPSPHACTENIYISKQSFHINNSFSKQRNKYGNSDNVG